MNSSTASIDGTGSSASSWSRWSCLNAVDQHVVAGACWTFTLMSTSPRPTRCCLSMDARARLEAEQLLVIARGQWQLMHFRSSTTRLACN